MARNSTVEQCAPKFKVGRGAKEAPIFPGNKTPNTPQPAKKAINSAPASKGGAKLTR